MSSGCPVCQSWHDNDQECGHWCHFAGAEDWHKPRGEGEHSGS